MMILVYLSMFFTLLSLLVGVVFMGKGGMVNKKYSGTLMSLRVGFQALAIIMVLIFYYTK